MKFATSCGLASITAWLLAISTVLAPLRFAIVR